MRIAGIDTDRIGRGRRGAASLLRAIARGDTTGEARWSSSELAEIVNRRCGSPVATAYLNEMRGHVPGGLVGAVVGVGAGAAGVAVVAGASAMIAVPAAVVGTGLVLGTARSHMSAITTTHAAYALRSLLGDPIWSKRSSDTSTWDFPADVGVANSIVLMEAIARSGVSDVPVGLLRALTGTRDEWDEEAPVTQVARPQAELDARKPVIAVLQAERAQLDATVGTIFDRMYDDFEGTVGELIELGRLLAARADEDRSGSRGPHVGPVSVPSR